MIESILFFSCTTFGLILGAEALKKIKKRQEIFKTAQGILAFTAVAIVASGLITLLKVSTLLFSQTPTNIWVVWWLADTLGIVVFGSALAFPRRSTSKNRQILEKLLFLTIFTTTTFFIFSRKAYSPLSEPYSLFPLFLWAIFRLGWRSFATGSVVLTFLSAYLFTSGSGPFVNSSSSLPTHLQLYLTINTASLLTVMALMNEYRRREVELNDALKFSNAIFEKAPVAIHVFNRNGTSLRMNDAQKEFLGFPSKDYGVGEFNILTDPLALAMGLSNHFLRCYKGETINLENRKLNLNAPESRWSTNSNVDFFDQLIFPIKNATGQVEAAVSFTRDITDRKKMEKELKQKEKFLQLILNSLSSSIVVLNRQGMIMIANRVWQETIGLSANLGIGDRYLDLFKNHPSQEIDIVVKSMLRGTILEHSMEQSFFINGDRKWFLIQINRLNYPDSAAVIAHVDITRSKLAEESLKTSEERFRSLCTCSPLGIYQTDAEGRMLYTNESWQKISGLTHTESLNEGWLRSIHPEDRDTVLRMWKKSIEEKDFYRQEFRFVTKDNEVRWISSQASPITTAEGKIVGYVGTNGDITEQKVTLEKLKSALSEKETLLREVHHRVKNNLAIVAGLLNLQINKTGENRTFINETQNRIHSMLLVHEMLYTSSSFSSVSLASYVKNLCNHLANSYTTHLSPREVITEVEDLSLELDVAIPFGLILTELVSNALKHAFPNYKYGQVQVVISSSANQIIVQVIDNGCGLPKDFDIDKTHSIGLRLIKNLSKQLNGNLEINKEPVTNFKLTFNRKGK